MGLGFMNGRQKLLYLPEAHKDFIYAVAGEEMGMIGSVGLLLGFSVIFWRGLRATLRISDDFGRYLALGADGRGRSAGLHAYERRAWDDADQRHPAAHDQLRRQFAWSARSPVSEC